MAVTLKLVMSLPSGKSEVRRFTTSEAAVYGALVRYLETTYSPVYQSPLHFVVEYDDGEDLIAISSEAEFAEGLALHQASNAGAVWKLMCRFDDAPLMLSGLNSPSVGLSGMSTPAIGPPSPSRQLSRSSNSSAPPVNVKSPPAEEDIVVLGSAGPTASSSVDLKEVGKASIDASIESFGDINLVDAERDQTPSDDEYERIDEPDAQEGRAVLVSPVAKTVEEPAKPTAAEPVVESTPAAVASVVTEPTVVEPAITPVAATVAAAEDPFDAFIDQRGPERFACRVCPKLFKGRAFLVEHLKSRHPDKIVTPAVESVNETAAAAVPTAATDAALVVETAVSAPKVDESSPKSSPVEITDVTGHHEHVDPTPSPDPQVTEPSTSSSSSLTAAPTGPVIHHGITCDGCGAHPITGIRFHCTACLTPGGYDLCESCESRGSAVHPSTHVLLKMRTPAHVPVGTAQRHLHCPRMQGRSAANLVRPKAQFISDVTLADGLQVHAGETLTKVWSIKNNGTEAWPIGTRIVFAGGDLAPESENLTDSFGAAVPYAGPNDVVHVSIAIQVPNQTGRFRGTFRLETPQRVRFGPRIWIDLVVPEEGQEQTAAAEAPAAEEAEAPKKAEPVAITPKAAEAPAAAPAVVAAPPSAESKQREEDALSSALAESHNSAVAAESRRHPAFQYPNQLVTLRSMGFMDAELCRYLLLNNAGDLEKVVAWLLSNASK